MDVEGTVRTVLKELEIDTASMHAGTRLREDLQVDSTELVEIAVALERVVPVAIDIDDILAVQTFADLVTCVRKAPRR
jgi:acyl carrier protein